LLLPHSPFLLLNYYLDVIYWARYRERGKTEILIRFSFVRAKEGSWSAAQKSPGFSARLREAFGGARVDFFVRNGETKQSRRGLKGRKASP
jgi:catalase